jgi:hypothetical protein
MESMGIGKAKSESNEMFWAWYHAPPFNLRPTLEKSVRRPHMLP